MNRIFFTSKNKAQFSIPRTTHAEIPNNRAGFSIPTTIDKYQLPEPETPGIATSVAKFAGVFLFVAGGLFTASGMVVADHSGTYQVSGGRDANDPYRWEYDITADGDVQDISHLNVQLDCFTDNLSSVVVDIEKTQGEIGQINNGDPSTGTTGDLIKWDELSGTSATLAFTLNDIYPEISNGALIILKSGSHTGDIFMTANGPDCTPVPDPEPATLTLVKTVDNSAGGDATTSDFQAYVNGDAVNWDTTLTLDAGTYTASEDTLTNYSASDWGGDCATDGTVALEEGEDATCTITNTYVPEEPEDPKGSINVCKIAIDHENNVIEGPSNPSVEFKIHGMNTTTSEGGPAGVLPTTTFTTPLNLDTDILGLGEGNSECVLYDDLDIGNYYYSEEEYPATGWEDPLYNDQFTTSISSLAEFYPYSGELFDGDPSTDGDRDKNVDGHIVLTESRPNRTLVVLNQTTKPEPATLIVIKNVDNTGGGTLSPEDFTMEVTGSNVSTSTFPGSSTGTTVTLDSGSYSVDEQDSFGYDKTLGDDCSGIIDEGETKTCVVTNTFVPEPDPVPATLTLVKTVDNSAGGDATTSDFQAYVNGDAVNWDTTLTLDAGTYTASEDTLTNYSASDWGDDCTTDGTVTLEEGEDATCTITNTYVPVPEPETYEISGVKFHDQNNNGVWNSGEPTLSGWIINLAGDATSTITTDSNGEYEFGSLAPGNYTICEVQQSGWSQTHPSGNNGCHAIEITDNDTADVNFGNRTVTTTSGGSPTLNIVKDVEPAITNPGGTVVYTVTVSNTGNRTAINVVLTDTLPDGLVHEDTGLAIHSWNLGNMSPGQSITTTFNALVGEDVENGFYVNTAEADASNHGPVSDDAEVEVRGAVLGDEADPILEITKTGDRTLVNPGSQMTYTVTITNVGEAPAVNLVVTDTLPEGFTLAEDGSEVIVWNIPLLEAGESWEVSFLVNISEDISEGEHLNVVEANAENYDGELFDSYLVESREGEVLGDTGVSLSMILIWLLSVLITILVVVKVFTFMSLSALQVPQNRR